MAVSSPFARACHSRRAAGSILTYFPNLTAGRHEQPALHELVQLRSRDVSISTIWKGEAQLTLHDHPFLELAALRPRAILAGYRFSFAFTVDDLAVLEDLRE